VNDDEDEFPPLDWRSLLVVLLVVALTIGASAFWPLGWATK